MRSDPRNVGEVVQGGRIKHRSFLVVLLLMAGLLLFFADNRTVNIYDEGITLTAAMRIAAGQVIYRDFYYNYGPANVYILAGLFKVFGEYVLVERLWFLFQAVITATGIYVLARRLSNRVAGIGAFLGGLLWSETLGFITLGFMTFLTLWSTWLLVPFVRRKLSFQRSLAAGLMVGITALFRNDIGVGLAGAHIATLGVLSFIKERRLKESLRSTASMLWPYLLGCGIPVLPVFVAYSISHAIPDLLYDIVLYPRKYYHAARNLPFPAIGPKNLEDLVVYVLPVLIATGFYAAIHWIIERRRLSTDDAQPTPIWVGAVIAYGFVAVIMYMKGLVRIGAGPLYMCSGVCLLIAAVLYAERKALSPVVRALSLLCIVLFALGGVCSTSDGLLTERSQRASMLKWFIGRREKQGPLPPLRWWCKEQNAVSKGPCYFVDDDHIQAITYLDEHTTRNDTLYVGLAHMDRIFANDTASYFAAQRLPATKWSHFDPFLQNRADIQQEMIGEMERNRPPYVVLDSEFQDAREPNGSSVSTGVHLLDNYFETHYHFAAKFGELTVLRRNE